MGIAWVFPYKINFIPPTPQKYAIINYFFMFDSKYIVTQSNNCVIFCKMLTHFGIVLYDAKFHKDLQKFIWAF